MLTNLKAYRIHRGMSQRDLASKVGIDQTRICRLENKIIKRLKSTDAANIRNILGIPSTTSLLESIIKEDATADIKQEGGQN